MKTITTIGLAIAALAISATSATAQRFGGGFRASTPTYRAPTPVYRAPTPAYHPPAPTVTYRQPVRATPPAARPAAPRTVTVAKPRPPVATVNTTVRTTTRTTVDTPSQRPAPRSTYRHGSRNYAWYAPSLMPIWWMAAMHQPYSASAYDSFVRECIQTPRERRSRECVRALRERGIA